MFVAHRLVALAAMAAVAGWPAGAALAGSLASIYAFPAPNGNGVAASGVLPTAGLTPDPEGSGTLYGTTSRGGSYAVNGYGGGVVFALTPPTAGKAAWKQTVLHAFTGLDDGIFPAGSANPLVQGGNVFGTTVGNAPGILCGRNEDTSCDTVYELTPPAAGQTKWTYHLLYRFAGGKYGFEPQGGLTAGPGGVLYGTTAAGANEGCQSSFTNNYGTVGCGTVFQLAPPAKSGDLWAMTVLHTFSGGSDGGIPMAALLPDPGGSGVLYGTASTGGSTTCSFGAQNCGVVFKLAPPAAGQTAWKETVLYSFAGGTDGLAPLGALAIGSGVLYGTAQAGGYGCDIYGCGTVFQLTPPAEGKTKWAFKALHAFKGGTDGGAPKAGLLVSGSGALYGTTFQFGDGNVDCAQYAGCGTVFVLSPPTGDKADWTETVLYRFNDGGNGGQSSASLAVSGSVLYGTAALGGVAACRNVFPATCGGVVFEVTP